MATAGRTGASSETHGRRLRFGPFGPGVPLQLAEAHADVAVGEWVELSLSWPRLAPVSLSDIVAGAGFEAETQTRHGRRWEVTARRARTLPDYVAAGMGVLVCGLNPSVVAADAGFGYAGPTNRFWPAAQAAGLVHHPRQPALVLREDGVGMTDLVKRATPKAAMLAVEEYACGAERVRRLVEWLRPRLVLFVGLSGWRAAVDRGAVVGLQPGRFGGALAYVMPSTSGLNAHARLRDLEAHMRGALALASSEAAPAVGEGR